MNNSANVYRGTIDAVYMANGRRANAVYNSRDGWRNKLVLPIKNSTNTTTLFRMRGNTLPMIGSVDHILNLVRPEIDKEPLIPLTWDRIRTTMHQGIGELVSTRESYIGYGDVISVYGCFTRPVPGSMNIQGALIYDLTFIKGPLSYHVFNALKNGMAFPKEWIDVVEYPFVEGDKPCLPNG